MKHLFVALLAIIVSCVSFAQNGGQYPENDNIKFEYAGMTGSNYYAKIINKKACPVTVKTEYNHAFAEVTIPASNYYIFDLGPAISPLKAKTININCGSPDNGWIEFLFNSLPLTFTSTPVFAYDEKTDILKITFTVAEAKNVSHINVRVSFDGGRTKKQIGLMFLDFMNPNSAYTFKIKGADLLKSK